MPDNAFDASTNTSSVSFSASWAIAVIAPSATDQWVSGYKRNVTSRRYFEFKVRELGGNPKSLYLGIGFQGSAGGSPTVPPSGLTRAITWNGIYSAQLLSGSLTVVGSSPVGLPTISQSDIWMFLVEFSADGNYHDVSGSAVISSLTASSPPHSMQSVVTYVGRNGIWYSPTLPAHVNWKADWLGFYGWTSPVVLRANTTSTTAVVELATTTLSFVYPIPSGAVAWGDGPQLTTAASIDWTGGWDIGTIGSDQTLTFTNTGSYYYGHDSIGSITSSVITVKTAILPTTGKRVFEIWGRLGAASGAQNGHFGASWSATSPGRALPHNYAFGFCDANLTSISYSTSGIAAEANIAVLFGAVTNGAPSGNTMYRRAVVDTNYINLQSAQAIGTGSFGDGLTIWVDFDAQRFWFRRGVGAANAFANGGWSGFTQSDSRGPDPYVGTNGFSLSASLGAGGLRFIIATRKSDGAGLGNTAYINVGQNPLYTYPLLPGWKSLDGQRVVNGGNGWDTSIMPSSLSVCFTGLGVRSGARIFDTVHCRSMTKYWSGKRYFEIFCEAQLPAANANSLTNVYGLLLDGVTTLTCGLAQASLGPLGIWCEVGGAGTGAQQNIKRLRYSNICVNISQSATLSGLPGSAASGTGIRTCVAVDFDAGKVWFGYWNAVKNAVAWAVGADPATGASPDFTFTASTTFYACGPASRTTYNWNILCAESGNVVGLPSGFTPWNGASGNSISASPSTASPSAGGVLNVWPTGVQT